MKRRAVEPKVEVVQWVTCKACGKLGYPSRRAAKARIRQMERREGRLNAYRCLERPDLWHVGHPPPELRHGEVARDELKPKRKDTL